MSLPSLFNRRIVDLRLARAAKINADATLLDYVAEDLERRLTYVLRDFTDVLDLYTPGRQIVTLFRKRALNARLTRLTDLPNTAKRLGATHARILEEGLGARRFDCVTSLLGLQTVSSLERIFQHVYAALKPDGLFIAAFLGGSTLQELRTAFVEAEIQTRGGAAQRVIPMITLADSGRLLQHSGFRLPVTDHEALTFRYDQPADLIADLRAMGLTNVCSPGERPLSRETIALAHAIYKERFSDSDGRVRATFDIIWLSGWAPHPSQQKPLSPGSAAVRLVDVFEKTGKAAPNSE